MDVNAPRGIPRFFTGMEDPRGERVAGAPDAPSNRSTRSVARQAT